MRRCADAHAADGLNSLPNEDVHIKLMVFDGAQGKRVQIV